MSKTPIPTALSVHDKATLRERELKQLAETGQLVWVSSEGTLPPKPTEPAHGQLLPEVAMLAAKRALGYSAAFDGKGIDWQSMEPWPHRMELAQALDWITDLGAMVLNLAERVAAADRARQASPPAAAPELSAALQAADDLTRWANNAARDELVKLSPSHCRRIADIIRAAISKESP